MSGEPSRPGNACADVGAGPEQDDLARWLREAQTTAALEHLAVRIAQDFNHLLATMMGTADLLSQAGEDGRDALANVEDLIESVRDGADLTRLLHALGRREATPPRVVDPSGVATSVDRLLRTLIGDDVELVTEPAPRCWPVVADPGQLALVLINLALNGRDAMPDGGTLHLRTENVVVLDGDGPRRSADVATGEYAALIVQDSGAGIPPADLPKVFDPLFTTKRGDKPRGLGLATVAGIVRQLGGYVSVESTVGKGSTFTVLLPRSAKAVPGDGAVPLAPCARQAASILVVEEDGAVRLSVKRALEHLGYRVHAAANRATAIDLLKTSGDRVHLVISDVVLPELHRRVLGAVVNDADEGPRVLYMSGRPDVDQLTECNASLDVAVLRKPFSVFSLAEAVHERIGARR